jgi:outer membrane protein assembly factor BamB
MGIGRGRGPQGLILAAVVAVAVIGLAVGAMLWPRHSAPRGVTASPRQQGSRVLLDDPAALLDSAVGPDVLAFTTGSGSRELVRFDPREAKVRWRVRATPSARFLVTAALIFLANHDELAAVEAESGHVRWRAPLTDDVPSECADCLVPSADGAVIVSTRDRRIQAFDGESGARRWSYSPVDVGGAHVLVGDGRVRILDKDADRRRRPGLLHTLSPEGETVASVPMVCATPRGPVAPRYQDRIPRDRNGFYVAFPEGCLQKYDWTGGTMLWTRLLDGVHESGLPSGEPLLTPQYLFWPYARLLVQVDVQNGGVVHAFAADGSFELVPAVAHEGVLLAAAYRRVGSSRTELHGLDLATGETRWRLALGDSTWMQARRKVGLLNAASGRQAWTVQAAGPEGTLVQVSVRQGAEVQISRLSLRDGTLREPRSVGLPSGHLFPPPDVLGWRGQVLWLLLDNQVWAIDTATARLLHGPK